MPLVNDHLDLHPATPDAGRVVGVVSPGVQASMGPAIMNHPAAKLDEKRQSLIRKALKSGYTETDLYVAIRGCSYTPHNMGQNDRGERFDGLHIIMRDIDRFIGNYHKPPQGNKNGTTKKSDYDELDEVTDRIIAEQESSTHKSCD